MKKILFIDDSEDNLNLYKIYFKKVQDIEAVFELDPIVGLEKASSGNFDIIFLDLAMPEISGWDVISKLKEAQFKGKIIALTGSTDLETVERINDASFDGYLSKPILKKDLVNFVKEY